MSDDYNVGYGKPPKATQFRKGVSGNPLGRRSKSKNIKAQIRKELDEKISVQSSTGVKRISKRDALVLNLVNGALKGDPKALAVILSLLGDGPEPEYFDVRPQDTEMLNEMLEEIAKSDKKKGTGE